jgi:hypothetical protein
MRATAILLVRLCFASSLLGQDQEAIEWASNHFRDAFERSFPKATGTAHVFVRAHHDLHYSFPEFSVTLEYSPLTGVVSLNVREAVDESLFLQLQRLYRAGDAHSFEEVLSGLRVRSISVTDRTCPAVRDARKRFNSLRLAPPRIDEIVLHPVVYEVRVEGAAGRLNYDVIGGETTKIAGWAKAAIATARACSSGTN